MAARHRALFETVQQGLALNQPGSLARFQQKLQDQRQQQLRQEQDGQVHNCWVWCSAGGASSVTLRAPQQAAWARNA